MSQSQVPPPPRPDPSLSPSVPASEAAGAAKAVGMSSAGAETPILTGPPPQIGVKPGYQTSQGQLTAVFGLLVIILSFVGYKTTPDKLQNVYEGIVAVGKTIGPLLAYIPILINYINSRGKIQSNSIWATASMNNPLVKNDNLVTQAGGTSEAGLGGLGDVLRALGGGSGVKDPATYIGLAKIVGQLAGGKVGQTIGQVTGGSTSNPVTVDPKELEQALAAIVTAIRNNEAAVVAWWNQENPTQHADTLADVARYAVVNTHSTR